MSIREIKAQSERRAKVSSRFMPGDPDLDDVQGRCRLTFMYSETGRSPGLLVENPEFDVYEKQHAAPMIMTDDL